MPSENSSSRRASSSRHSNDRNNKRNSKSDPKPESTKLSLDIIRFTVEAKRLVAEDAPKEAYNEFIDTVKLAFVAATVVMCKLEHKLKSTQGAIRLKNPNKRLVEVVDETKTKLSQAKVEYEHLRRLVWEIGHRRELLYE